MGPRFRVAWKQGEVRPYLRVEVGVHRVQVQEWMNPSCRLDYQHIRAQVDQRVAHKVRVEVGHHRAYEVDLARVHERNRKNPVCPGLAFPVPWASRVREVY